MKKRWILLALVITIFLVACSVQPNTPLLKETPVIETQATAWQLLGTSLDVIKSATSTYSSSAFDKNNRPIVAWQEYHSNSPTFIYVKQWIGSEWRPMGSLLNVDAKKFAYQPSLAVDKAGLPVVAWEEDGVSTRNVYVKRWNGNQWVQLGSALNATAGDGAQNVSLAIDNLGNPVVAWQEDAIRGNGSQENLYVKRWNGTAWIQLGLALDIDISRAAYFPSMAVDNLGNPVVAWMEFGSFLSESNVYVKRWTGSAWQQVGGPLDMSLSGAAVYPSLAVDSLGRPVVAWEEGSNIYVKRWTGSLWQQIGTTPLDINPIQNAIQPSLALDSASNPVIVWQEFNNTTFYNLYARRWNGTAWVNIGVNPLEAKTSNYAFNASIALDTAGNPVISWEECDATQIHSSGQDCLTGADIYVRRYVTNGWQPFGNALDIDLSNNANYSSMARKSNDRPVVAWQEFGNVYVKEWSGTSWTRLGGKLNNIGGNTPVVAMRTDDKPVVAWSERIDPSSEVYAIRVKYWNGTGWQNQGSINMVSVHSFVLTIGSGNNPIIAYSTFGNNGEGINLYVKRWNGTAWVGMNGSATVTALDVDIALDAGVPSLAVDSTGKPTVAWAESFGLSSSIYIKRWNGSSWVQLGANLENAAATNPSLDLDSTGKPVVAWEERVFDGATTQTNIAIKRWNGTSWVSYGSGQAVDKFLGSHAFDAVVQLRSDDLPVVVMTQLMLRDGINSNDVYMRRWNASLNQWVDFGVPIDKNIAFNASNPSFILKSNNNPIVSWDEDDGVSRNVYVSQY